MPATRSIPFNLSCHAEENTDVTLLKAGTSENTTEGEHDVLGILLVKEPNFQQCVLELFVHQLLLFRNSERPPYLGPVFVSCVEYFIAAEEHRLRDIEGGVRCIGWDRHQPVAVPKFIIR